MDGGKRFSLRLLTFEFVPFQMDGHHAVKASRGISVIMFLQRPKTTNRGPF